MISIIYTYKYELYRWLQLAYLNCSLLKKNSKKIERSERFSLGRETRNENGYL